MTTPLDAVTALTAAIGAAQTLPSVYEAALDGLQRGFGVERASVLWFDGDGVMRFKAWRGLSDAYRAAVEGHTPWTPGQPTPEPVIVPDVRADASLAAYGSVFARERIVSLAFFPLVSDGGVIGKFMLYADHPAHFTAEEVSAGKAIGFLLGFAVERMQRMQASDRDRRRLLFALDAASMGTWDWNIQTQELQWSENLERLHGLPPGTFTGGFDSYEREIHPEDRSRVRASLQRALREGEAHDVQYRIVAPDGTMRWVHGKGRVERDADGQPMRMTGVCMDITSAKAAEFNIERALQEEEAIRKRLTILTDGARRLLTSLSAESVVSEVIALAEAVIDADAYAVWRRDDDAWRIASSRGLSESFSGTVLRHEAHMAFEAPVIAEDVAGVPMLDGRRNAYALERIASLVSIPLAIRGEPGGSVVFYYRSRHRPSDIELRVATALGQLAAAAISNADLYAEQQRLRLEAQEAETHAAFLAEASSALSSLDYELNLGRVAQLAVPRLSDWCAVDLLTPERAITRIAVTHTDPTKVALAHDIHSRYPPSIDDGFGIGFVLRTGAPQLYEDIPEHMVAATARGPEHRRLIEALQLQSVMIVPLSAGRHVFGAMTFVTERGGRRFTAPDLAFAMELARRAALAIENARLYKEAQTANRLKDEFLATLSHELRTPLNVILGRTRHLAEAANRPEAFAQVVATVERNARTLAQLVDDLLDVSRFTLGQVQLEVRSTEIVPVVNVVAVSLEPMARGKGVVLQVEADGRQPCVMADPTRLQQVIWNLLTNAIKFTPEGGRVDVRIGQEGDEAVLTVTDTGDGIAPEFLPHVFDMFRQGESPGTRAQAGLGLGLSIVRRLVEVHGGTVTAASRGRGLGATFRVALPCADTFSPTTVIHDAPAAVPASAPPDNLLT